MKIIKAVCTPVHIPMEAPLRWSMGVENGTTRTIVELHTDEGVIGLGETYGGASTAARFRSAEPFFLGYDPLEVSRIVKNFEVFRTTSEQSALTIELRYVAAAIEMACWDIVGKAQGKPVYELLGGAVRPLAIRSRYSSYLPQRNPTDSRRPRSLTVRSTPRPYRES